jgi:hypothetical protein
MADGFIPAIARRHELYPLYEAYLRMSGPAPVDPWNQSVYDRLVMGLLHHAPTLLKGV